MNFAWIQEIISWITAFLRIDLILVYVYSMFVGDQICRDLSGMRDFLAHICRILSGAPDFLLQICQVKKVLEKNFTATDNYVLTPIAQKC